MQTGSKQISGTPWRYFYLVVSVCLILLSDITVAATPDRASALLRTAFIEKLTRFIEWPTSDHESFKLCVAGNGQMLASIKDLAAVTPIKDRPVKVVTLSKPDAIANCELVYLSTTKKSIISSVVNAARGKPILTIGDGTGLAEQGVIINFFEKNNRLRFEINLQAAKQSGLIISSRLLKVAKIVMAAGGAQ